MLQEAAHAPRTGYSCTSYPTGYDSKARQSPLPSSDSSQVPGTCSSFPLVVGRSNVAC